MLVLQLLILLNVLQVVIAIWEAIKQFHAHLEHSIQTQEVNLKLIVKLVLLDITVLAQLEVDILLRLESAMMDTTALVEQQILIKILQAKDTMLQTRQQLQVLKLHVLL